MLVHASDLRARGIHPMVCTGSLQAAKAQATRQMNRRIRVYTRPPEDIVLDHYGLIYKRQRLRSGDRPKWGPWV